MGVLAEHPDFGGFFARSPYFMGVFLAEHPDFGGFFARNPYFVGFFLAEHPDFGFFFCPEPLFRGVFFGGTVNSVRTASNRSEPRRCIRAELKNYEDNNLAMLIQPR